MISLRKEKTKSLVSNTFTSPSIEDVDKIYDWFAEKLLTEKMEINKIVLVSKKSEEVISEKLDDVEYLKEKFKKTRPQVITAWGKLNGKDYRSQISWTSEEDKDPALCRFSYVTEETKDEELKKLDEHLGVKQIEGKERSFNFPDKEDLPMINVFEDMINYLIDRNDTLDATMDHRGSEDHVKNSIWHDSVLGNERDGAMKICFRSSFDEPFADCVVKMINLANADSLIDSLVKEFGLKEIEE